MKLALKLVSVCLIAMILITAFASYWIARREYRLVQEKHQSSAERIGGLIRESLDLAYNNEGNQGIVKVLKTHAVDSGDVQYRWVWFDVSTGDSAYPLAPMQSLERVLAGEMSSVIAKHKGPDLLYTYFPLNVNDESVGKARKGALEISGSLQSAEEEAWRTAKTGLVAISAMAVFCFAFIGWSGIRLIGRPLEKLTEQTRRIGQGVYDQPTRLKTNDEIGELSAALNTMSKQIAGQQLRIIDETAARVSTMQQLRHADRLKTVGRLAAGVAHELGTPLNVISGRAGLIRSGKLSAAELDESAAAIQSESNRIAGIIRQLMDFARHNPLQRTSVDLRVLVDRTVELLRPLADEKSITIELTLAKQGPYSAFADESQIQQVLTNLFVNAIQAMSGNGRIEVSLDNVDEEDQCLNDGPTHDGPTAAVKAPQFVRVVVQDDGPGMDDETREQIFEPFFTTKDVGKGTGLGLSIVYGIVEEHGGEIEVASQPGKGTTFRILLPKFADTHRSEAKV